MSTKNVSKCSYYGKVLLDLTGDTVTTSTLKKGATAHDATGTKITGTLTVPATQTKTMDLDMASGDQVVKPDSGKVLSQVTVKKPSTFTAENIKKDVNIGGVVGTLTVPAVQPSKSLTITSNGTVSVTPDAPYDALKKVDVTVDVASGGSGYSWYDFE